MSDHLYIYKAESGRYRITAEDMDEHRVAVFSGAGDRVASILSNLTIAHDGTVSDALNTILLAIHGELANNLNEEWTKHLIPCERASAMKATRIKKDLKRQLGKDAAREVMGSLNERVLYHNGTAARLLLSPYGQCVKIRA